MQRLLKILLNALFRVKISYDNNLQFEQPILILPNHTSLLDAVILYAYLPKDVYFVVNKAIAQKYSFIVILPFLITALGFLRKAYTDRLSEQRKKAEQSLETFRGAISSGQADKVNVACRALRQFSKYLSVEDLEWANTIEKLSRAEASDKSVATDEFSKWPEIGRAHV